MVSVTIDRRDGLNSAAAIKGPCRVATTANITLTGLQTVDGVALAEGDRVLVKDQTDARDNGIRIASTGNWERSADFRNSRDIVTGTQVYITHGTASAERWYGVTAANPISVGTTNLTFAVADVLSQVEAIAAAFPAVTANTMLVDNPAGTARETKTFPEVRSALTIPVYVASRTSLKALDTTKDTLAWFDGSAWKWTAGDYSTLITADTQEGIHVKANAIASTAGAWVRQYDEEIKPEWFGALGGSTDDHMAIQAAWDMGATLKKVVVHTQPLRASDELKTSSDLHVRFSNGAWLRQTGFSSTGSFITNLRNSSSDAASIQSNITFENPQIDGSLFPSPIALEIASSTATTATFTAAASAVDDFYVGYALEDTTGANAAGLRIVTSYVGSTRTATFATAWVSNPVAGTIILAGWNDNAFGFAAGVSNIRIIAGYIKGYQQSKMVPSATGGKGVNFEQGVTNGLIMGTMVEDCGTGYFVQGLDGTFANGSKKRAVSIQIIGVETKNCGSAVTLAGVNGSADPDGDSDDSLIVVNGVTYENCGHSPYRLVASDQQKSGVINFLEAQNVSVSNVRGRNDATYPGTSPGYPTDYTARCGYGLTGNIGAVFWGWGRNIKVNGVVHHNNVDNLITVRRGRALGDDAGSSGAPENCFNWSFRGVEHHGVINEYVIRIDPTLANRVVAAELTGEIEVSVNGGFITSGIVDTNMSAFTSVKMLVRDHAGLKQASGTPSQINTYGNAMSAYTASEETDLRTKRLANTAFGSGGPAILSIVAGSAAYDFGSVAAHTQVSTTITVTGAVVSTKSWCLVTYNGTDPAGLVFKAQVTSADTVTLYCLNTTAGAVSAVNRTYNIMVIRTA